MFVGIVLGAAIIGESVDITDLLWHIAGCALISLDFGLIVYLLGGGIGLKGPATGAATIIAFMSYLISSLVVVADFLEPYEKFSLFHYYQNPSPVSWQHAALLLGVAVILIAGALITFPRRDINT
jgi:ABC-2 type transport system permease protein